jgi:hypothetical protein
MREIQLRAKGPVGNESVEEIHDDTVSQAKRDEIVTCCVSINGTETIDDDGKGWSA